MFPLTRCLRTSDTPGMMPVFICRLVMGVFFFTAGFNKLFVPENQLLIVAFLECFMGLLLTLGLFTRFSDLTLTIISSVAMATIGIYTIPPGLNLIAWLSWLFYLPEALYIVLGLVLMSLGGTCYSVDGWLVKRWQNMRKIIFIDG